jgi:hypothetical protein
VRGGAPGGPAEPYIRILEKVISGDDGGTSNPGPAGRIPDFFIYFFLRGAYTVFK